MKQTCSNQLRGELVTATDKATTNQLVHSNQIRIRATQTAASIEKCEMQHFICKLTFSDKRAQKSKICDKRPTWGCEINLTGIVSLLLYDIYLL